MKTKLILCSLMFFFISLTVSSQQKGLSFIPSDTTQLRVSNDGIQFLQSNLENSSLWLAIQPHTLKSEFLHLNIIINLNKQNEHLSISPQDIELKLTNNNNQVSIIHCTNPQLIVDEIAYNITCIKNSAYLASVQQQSGLLGLSGEKKKLRKSVTGVHKPEEFALLGNLELNNERLSCMGLAIAPKINKKIKYLTVKIPVGQYFHEFNFNVLPFDNVDTLSSPLSVAYLKVTKDVENQMKIINANTLNIAANAFNQGFKQGIQQTNNYQNQTNNYQNQSNSAYQQAQNKTADLIPGTSYLTKKMYLDTQKSTLKSQLKRVEQEYKDAPTSSHISYQPKIDRLNREINDIDMKILDLDQMKLRGEIR